MSETNITIGDKMKLSNKQKEIVNYLKEKQGKTSYKDLKNRFNQKTINSLLGSEVIKLKEDSRYCEDNRETYFFTSVYLDTMASDGYSVTTSDGLEHIIF